MAHRVQLAAIALVLVAGCGIDVVGVEVAGVGADGGVASTSSAPDGSVAPDGATGSDGGAPTPADCSKPTCERVGLAAPGFTAIAFGSSADVCPGGFDTAEAFEDPTAKNGSCSCVSCTTTGSTCTSGKLATSYSTDASCNKDGATISAGDGQCVLAVTSWASTYGGIGAPDPKVGTCRAPATGVRDAVAATGHRLCTPRADACAAALCSLTGTLEVCLVAPGDVACPSVAPQRRLVGDVTMACDDCSCTPGATCSGKLHWWSSSSSCSGTESGVASSGVCTRISSSDLDSYRWEGMAAETCTLGSPPAKAKVGLGGVRTVCCPKP